MSINENVRVAAGYGRSYFFSTKLVHGLPIASKTVKHGIFFVLNPYSLQPRGNAGSHVT
jgi:hypothetical protein